MEFDVNQATDILKNPRSKQMIDSAKAQESQLRVFTEEMSEAELKSESYWNSLLAKMKARSDKKFDRVIQFARYPLPVVQLCDSVLNDYFKVFEGKNRYFNAEGSRDIQGLTDWINQNSPAEWIERHARKVFKNKPNSFVVVDVDASGTPYLVYVDSSRLIDAVFKNDEGDLEYIAFIHSVRPHPEKSNVSTTFFSVYDEHKYFVFQKDSDSDSIINVTEVSHGIGYCPAKSFIRTSTNSKNKFKRKVAFSSALSSLEDWTIFDIFRNYVDHYAPFPVTEAPKNKCANNDCEDGKVSEELILNPASGETKTIWKDCEACGGADKGAHIYPGTHIGIKISSDPDRKDGSGMFRMIFPDTDKLKYVPEKLDDIELEVRFKTVGVNSLSNEAFNELQVKGSFSSMESVLTRVKSELDHLYIWTVKTVGKVMYSGVSVSVDANFGTEFYLVSEEDLQTRFDNAKKIGLPAEEQINLYKQLVETKYKGNANKMKRALMLIDLDPFPMQSIKDCADLKNESVLDDFQLSLKVNFMKFISKFEAENSTITAFGANLEYWQRIEIIQSTIETYNQELIDKKNSRNNPKGSPEGEDQPTMTQEQLDAQANLRGSVGGVQGILGIQASVSQGITSMESAIATLIEIYGFNRETAVKILGTEKKTDPKPDPAKPDPTLIANN